MKNGTYLLRICYWLGAALDARAAVLLTSAAFGARSPGMEAAYRNASGIAAALMWGWTALLLWADRKPRERKGVLLITLFPVLGGLGLNAALDLAKGGGSSSTGHSLIVGALLFPLFIYSYARAAIAARRGTDARSRPDSAGPAGA